MMENVWIVIAYISAVGVWIRLLPYLKFNSLKKNVLPSAPQPPISIVIPVRNEAKIIGKLLDSLLQLDYSNVEVIVVDDSSTDHTKQIAEHYPVKIITAPPKPPGWVGKSWACNIGASHANGKYILFTDADTIHKPDSLKRALHFLQETKSKLISAPAFHINKLWWEKILGPFFCILHAGASPFDKVSVDHPYALGQYLLIEKEFYYHIGGHASVREELADDASLAKVVIQNNGTFKMFGASRLCEVQMYGSFKEFTQGWLRILRLGMRELKISVFFYTLLPLFALNFSGLLTLNLISYIPIITTLICFALVQSRIGNFRLIGVLLFPISALLFVALASWATISHLLNLPIVWRGRIYIPNRKVTMGNA
jgi:glycosyltransferase involved in cell wall biosynthesis